MFQNSCRNVASESADAVADRTTRGDGGWTGAERIAPHIVPPSVPVAVAVVIVIVVVAVLVGVAEASPAPCAHRWSGPPQQRLCRLPRGRNPDVGCALPPPPGIRSEQKVGVPLPLRHRAAPRRQSACQPASISAAAYRHGELTRTTARHDASTPCH